MSGIGVDVDGQSGGPALDVLRGREDWKPGIEKVRDLLSDHGDKARAAAAAYSTTYAGRRAAMVFDVVASRQRNYERRVLPMVERFASTDAARSLGALAAEGPGGKWGLRDGEVDTMQKVAEGLVRYCTDHGLDDDDEGAAAWAAQTRSLVSAHRLDPYVGSVKGIGPALFGYLRMRSGGDGLKPDTRVRTALQRCGFDVPRGDVSLLALATAIAAEVGVELLVLDQLLWRGV